MASTSEYSVHPNQIRQWRRQLMEKLRDLFSDRRKREEKNRDELEDELHRQIGRFEIFDPGSNGEAVFSPLTVKMAFGHQTG
jgi:hypothetical protein